MQLLVSIDDDLNHRRIDTKSLKDNTENLFSSLFPERADSNFGCSPKRTKVRMLATEKNLSPRKILDAKCQFRILPHCWIMLDG